MEKNLEWLIQNIQKDIKIANKKEIDNLFDSLKEVLKKYDGDGLLKNINDWVNKLFRTKREKCKLILIDIIEEIEKPGFPKKEELRKDLLEISNIHRSFLENFISLLESL